MHDCLIIIFLGDDDDVFIRVSETTNTLKNIGFNGKYLMVTSSKIGLSNFRTSRADTKYMHCQHLNKL